MIIRLLRQVGKGPLRTFAIGFAAAPGDELPCARVAARRYDSEHHEEIVRPDAMALLPRLVPHFDEPFGDSSALPTLVVSEAARRHVTVALSGDGGDELLAGYRRYRHALRLQQFLDLVPSALRLLALLTLARWWPDSWRVKGFISRAAGSPDHLYRALMSRDDALTLLHPDVRREVGDNGRVHGFFQQYWDNGPLDFAARMQYVDFHTYLPEDILVKADRASMAVGLELRCPLLDHRVVELASRLPRNFKYFNGQQKFLFKQILLPDLGPAFVYRRKTGFQMPLPGWFRQGLPQVLRERLLLRPGPLADLCRPEAVAALLRRFAAGQRDLSEDLWRLLVLAEWLDQVHYGKGFRSEGR
ncbi:MAG: asparagine synthetase B family protein [Desulfobaccales bacterium]